jgi:hypothetical protein
MEEWTRGCLRCLLVEQILIKFAVSLGFVLKGTVEHDQLSRKLHILFGITSCCVFRLCGL